MFKKTPKQREACDLMAAHEHTLCYGGSRSGKTANVVRQILVRAAKKPSRHLMGRYRLAHAKASLWRVTIPEMLPKVLPGIPVAWDGSDLILSINPKSRTKRSDIWIAGMDDPVRAEKILGTEFSTIMLDEVSQIPWESVSMLHTRLAQNSGLSLRAYYLCNPPSKKHWSYQMFIEGNMPGTKKKHQYDVASILMNPRDNLDNLPPSYIRTLEAMPKRHRDRFLEGLFLTDIEGALWTLQMITDARAKEHEQSKIRRKVIAVDPSVSKSGNGDACGIVSCAATTDKQGVVGKDYTRDGRSTKQWAQAVVNAYHAEKANYVVAEGNQGGALVEDAIHNIDRNIKVKIVHARVGKLARAEPISMLYEQGRVIHTCDNPDLEAELTETDFTEANESPNRLDAMVWGLTDLLLKTPGQVHIG